MTPRPTPAEIDAWLVRFLAVWPGDALAATRDAEQVRHWGPVLARAARHGVLAPLAGFLDRKEPPRSDDVIQELRRRRALERLWQVRLQEDLGQLVGALEGAGIPTVALKGPILAERLYGDPFARFSTDIDLLIDPEHLDGAAAILISRGYAAGDGPAAARYLRRHHHHLSFVRSGHPRVELHFRAHAGFGVLIESQEWLGRAQRYHSPLGWSVSILAPEDEFIFLAVHAAEHCFDRLIWLLDLKYFLATNPELKWPLVWCRARNARVLCPVAVSVAMLRFLGVRCPVPCSCGNRWRTLTALRSLFGPWATVAPWDTPISLVQQAVLCDSAGLAVRHLGHHFGRIGRRRLWSAFPRWLPTDWQG
jgi:hypothetical protein